MHAIAVPPERHPFERADRPNRVEVPEQEHGAPVARKPRANMIAAIGLAQQLDAGARGAQDLAERRAASIDRGLVRAGRLQPNERLQRLNDVGSVLFALGQQMDHVYL